MDYSLFNKALVFAKDAHDGVSRKFQNIPYLLHPMEVAVIVSTITDDQEVLASALLHDTVEDTNTSLDEIEESFGPYVRFLVASETEDKRDNLPSETTWVIRKEESLKELKESTDRNVKILWLADKLSNMRSFYRLYLEEGDAMWNRFNQPDKELQAWYYRSVYEAVKQLNDTLAYQEFGTLIEKVFEGDSNESGTHQ